MIFSYRSKVSSRLLNVFQTSVPQSSAGVYTISCMQCDKVYVCETSRDVKCRNVGTGRYAQISSAIFIHVRSEPILLTRLLLPLCVSLIVDLSEKLHILYTSIRLILLISHKVSG